VLVAHEKKRRTEIKLTTTVTRSRDYSIIIIPHNRDEDRLGLASCSSFDSLCIDRSGDDKLRDGDKGSKDNVGEVHVGIVCMVGLGLL
jgi:hypothetical protein